jgi:hypothetical protein
VTNAGFGQIQRLQIHIAHLMTKSADGRLALILLELDKLVGEALECV